MPFQHFSSSGIPLQLSTWQVLIMAAVNLHNVSWIIEILTKKVNMINLIFSKLTIKLINFNFNRYLLPYN